jgi:hypothetical protein
MSPLQDAKNLRDFAFRNTMILRHFDARLEPDLQLAFHRLHVNFARVEVRAILAFSKDGWTQAVSIVALDESRSSMCGAFVLAKGTTLCYATPCIATILGVTVCQPSEVKRFVSTSTPPA